MESSYLDDLYGDFGSSDSPVACDESSLDIYSGLDHENSPRCSSNADKCANPFSPSRTKDSFDLYEEVITEERKERATSHSELLAKLEKTQTHVKELICKLQEMQNKNIGLNNENMLLKKNISALIKTARMEIVRKNEEIGRLQQRSGRGGFNQYCPRSLANFQRYVNTRQGNTDSPSGGGGSSTDASQRTRNTCIQNPGVNNTSQLPEKAATGTVQEDSSAHVPIHQNSIPSSHDVLGSDKPVSCSSDNCINDSRDMEHMHREAAGKAHKQATKSCMETTAKQLTVTEKQTTEAQESRERKLRYQEERNHSVRICISGKKEERSRERETAGREFKESEKDREKQSRWRSAHTEREQQRRSGKGKSPPRSKNRSLQLESSRHVSSELDRSKSRRKDSELVSRSSRRDPKHSQDQERSEKRAPESSIKEGKHTGGSFRSRHGDKAVTSSSRREEKSPTRDRYRKEEEKKSKGDKSKEERRKDECKRKEEEKKKGDQKREEKRRHEATKLHSSICRKDSEPEKKSDTSAEPENGVQIHGSAVQEVADNDGQLGQENSTEENGRNRKLCFMETLNLTLSPVKRPKTSTEEGELEKRLPGEGELAGDGVEVRQSDFFVDGCIVLGEAESSSKSSEQDKEVSEFLNTHSQKTHSNCVSENDLKCFPAADDADSEKIPFPLSLMEQDVISLKETKPVDTEVDAAVVDAAIQTLAADCDAIKAELLTKEPEVCATAVNTATCDYTVQAEALDAAVGAKAHNDTDVHSVALVIVARKLIRNDKTLDVKSNTESPTITLDAEAFKITTDNEDCLVVDLETNDITVDADNDITTDTEVNDISGQTKYNNCTAEAQAVAIGDVASTVTNTASQDVTMDTESNNSSTDLVSSTDTIETEPQSSDNTVIKENNLETQNSDYEENFTAEGEYDNSNMDTSSRCNQTKNDLIKGSSRAWSGLLSAQQEERSISSTLQESSGDPAFADTTSCHLQPDSSECDTLDVGPSHSEPVPKGPAEVLLHDEDSMLLALKTIRHIPEVISPLTSPARPLKRSPRHGCPGKPPYVRSLDKELSGIFKSFTPETKLTEVNKENQEPECSPLEETKEGGSSSSSSVEDELEEGEIVSDSEEEEKQVVIPCTRQIKKSPRLEKQPSSPKARTPAKQVKQAASQGNIAKKSKTNSTAIKNSPSPSNKSPSNKRRFQTVLTSLSNSDPSSIHEVMDMLKFIRKQIRKKYMKLHKSFPAKTFYNVIEMSLSEFTEFVKNLNCSKLSNSEQNLKSKLCKIITAMLKQISNNGIVNRIFEQNSPNLKSKLWIFVEQQFDCLFRELQAALINLCECADLGQPSDEKGKKDKDHTRKETKEEQKTQIKSPKTPVNKAKRKALETEPKSDSKKQKKLFKSPKTGLGSRGKNLNNYKEDKARNYIEPSNKVFKQNPGLSTVNTLNTVESPKKDVAPTINPATCTPRKPLNVPDKSDFSFQILTEQQASSLTFNLVTDSQMGEIFKCLLQGSDLLEQSTAGVESHSWLVGTPRKAAPGEEKLFMLPTPSKALTPMKVSTATPWSVISPEKFPAFGGRIRLPLNPASLDESCMLEVPCANLVDTEASLPQWSISHSVLTEDLAVSLTIPSPLKSDSHLSFLQPEHGEVIAVPDSVLNAHYSEDALFDGEDATEQDIHLALDSDNSSSSSDSSTIWPSQAIPPGFQFKPHLPMQAVVMERSNDHFIVKIRHTSTIAPSETEQKSLSNESKSLEPSEDEEMLPYTTDAAVAICNGTTGKTVINALCDNTDKHLIKESSSKVLSVMNSPASNQDTDCSDVNGRCWPARPARKLSETEEDDSSDQGASQNCSLPIGRSQDHSESEQCGGVCSGSKKRTRCHSEPAAKKPKRDTTSICKGKKKKRKRKSEESSSHSEKGRKSPSTKKCRIASSAQSPNSLSAKNVVKKKGAVLVAWTRDDDRAILVDIKKQGASEKTFCSLASRLNKSPSQVYERFGQLVKLFKKTEKMNS
ncbi:CASP8-associated protein 2-like isoform X1 [Acipenser ruthenus]|uniref:CASP8-associated protein 2-like isoform X1 n=1 Tax=Acipenser ruthenus TaxID=7906 RepID=UPI002741BF9A|nr:CASP8-associated protein 2-like isoform X1 [Acipenser ruthenus]XP_058879535.1 CASP8-associated protein 2-like isoform X1 [Acipenser ruthenus]